VKFIFPKYKQQLSAEALGMEEDLVKFYQDFDNIVVVVFGTSY